ncbi:helix-turn-helix domain-containing protein [Zobellia sp. B3R18]|uniref:helix-turn-helix domain-containing protein n=1 Tax=Zobellia sp. B3R18 TaxID=2841568 RepID=UPI001C06AA79|nr:helix-turn-helix transcriptional regulator [Zobellia sp. B3R18]MBU2974967.1 helix-turn-helix transcriptional regulator [Zobellia sp. B3R18]
MYKGLKLLITLFFICGVQAQDSLVNPDTLMSMTYDQLIDKMYIENDINKDLAIIYSKAYLRKAKNNLDSVEIAEGYIGLAITAKKYDTAMIYMDSVIDFTQNFNTQKYPASAYSFKSDIQYGHNKFKEALDNALIANDILKKWPVNNKTYTVKYQIGILRAIIGEHYEALKFYNASKNYFRENSHNYYEFTLFGLCESHLALKQLDSVAYYAQLGIESTQKNDKRNQMYFTYAFGELACTKGLYQKAIDSLRKSRLQFIKTKDLGNLAQNEYWLGVSKEGLGLFNSAISHFKRVDSLFDNGQKINPRLRGTWEKLIDFYKKKDCLKTELYYTKKLVKFDSIVNDDYKYLSTEINDKFDIPELVSDKEVAILGYKKNLTTWSIVVIVLACLLFLLGCIFYMYRKHKIKKLENYRLLVTKLKNEKPIDQEKEVKLLNLSPELEEKIKEGLNMFMLKQEYLKPNITVGDLAKTIGTNRKYLSQYINHVKGIKFPDYINTLRIEYALHRLQTNEGNFRVWRLNAVAKELGFSSAEYYSKAFKKHTNYKPNVYLENLIKNEKT